MFNSLLKRKGQIHMMESTIVLFVFFLMIIIGLTVYTNFQKGRLERVENMANEQKATELAKKIIFTPELECSNANARTMDCIEIQKLVPFKEVVTASPRYYKEEYGDTKATLYWVYAPAFPVNIEHPTPFALNTATSKVDPFTLFDFLAGGQDTVVFYFPITLWDKRFIKEWAYFGWLKIEVAV